MVNLTAAPTWLDNKGFYGPVTATLDWCEANYQFSPYIAEMANTFSNLFAIALSVCGWFEAMQESLPTRYLLGYMGVGLVGVGSFAFHATLLFQAQLADELPMIYVGSMSLWLLFDDKPGFGLRSTRTKVLIAMLAIFDILFTWSYYVYRNPVYHQVVFATIVIATIIRITYLLKYSEAGQSIPAKKKSSIAKLFTTGAGLFAFGFFIWNLDNIFCDTLTGWKVSMGWPAAFLLEGHSWWHVLTGSGSYYMFIGIQYVTLCIKDNPKNYTVEFRHKLPHVRRVHKKVQ
ncbi:ceramidase [Crucibulum laeve]|uniref:Ceramidase n=1 Tax=Crucibulum laeve TaxID=68775 RepID=A0A5C3M8T8_9AGAR|nr:ceramidase [Crucibulum laeve]